MELKNGYKLIYEVVVDGVRSFRASKTGAPVVDNEELDIELFKTKIGEYKLVYEYKGNLYGATEGIPAYDENGVPADVCLTDTENFRRVFVEGYEVAEPDVVEDAVEDVVETTENDESETD